MRALYRASKTIKEPGENHLLLMTRDSMQWFSVTEQTYPGKLIEKKCIFFSFFLYDAVPIFWLLKVPFDQKRTAYFGSKSYTSLCVCQMT